MPKRTGLGKAYVEVGLRDRSGTVQGDEQRPQNRPRSMTYSAGQNLSEAHLPGGFMGDPGGDGRRNAYDDNLLARRKPSAHTPLPNPAGDDEFARRFNHPEVSSPSELCKSPSFAAWEERELPSYNQQKGQSSKNLDDEDSDPFKPDDTLRPLDQQQGRDTTDSNPVVQQARPTRPVAYYQDSRGRSVSHSPDPELRSENPSNQTRSFGKQQHQGRVDPALQRANQAPSSCNPQDYRSRRPPLGNRLNPGNIQGQHRRDLRQGPQPPYSNPIPQQRHFQSTQQQQGRVEQGPVRQQQYPAESRQISQPQYYSNPIQQGPFESSQQYNVEIRQVSQPQYGSNPLPHRPFESGLQYQGENRKVSQPPYKNQFPQGPFESTQFHQGRAEQRPVLQQQFRGKNRQVSEPQCSSNTNQSSRLYKPESPTALRHQPSGELRDQSRAQRGPYQIKPRGQSPSPQLFQGNFEPRAVSQQHNRGDYRQDTQSSYLRDAQPSPTFSPQFNSQGVDRSGPSGAFARQPHYIHQPSFLRNVVSPSSDTESLEPPHLPFANHSNASKSSLSERLFRSKKEDSNQDPIRSLSRQSSVASRKARKKKAPLDTFLEGLRRFGKKRGNASAPVPPVAAKNSAGAFHAPGNQLPPGQFISEKFAGPAEFGCQKSLYSKGPLPSNYLENLLKDHEKFTQLRRASKSSAGKSIPKKRVPTGQKVRNFFSFSKRKESAKQAKSEKQAKLQSKSLADIREAPSSVFSELHTGRPEINIDHVEDRFPIAQTVPNAPGSDNYLQPTQQVDQALDRAKAHKSSTESFWNARPDTLGKYSFESNESSESGNRTPHEFYQDDRYLTPPEAVLRRRSKSFGALLRDTNNAAEPFRRRSLEEGSHFGIGPPNQEPRNEGQQSQGLLIPKTRRRGNSRPHWQSQESNHLREPLSFDGHEVSSPSVFDSVGRRKREHQSWKSVAALQQSGPEYLQEQNSVTSQEDRPSPFNSPTQGSELVDDKSERVPNKHVGSTYGEDFLQALADVTHQQKEALELLLGTVQLPDPKEEQIDRPIKLSHEEAQARNLETGEVVRSRFEPQPTTRAIYRSSRRRHAT